MWSSNSKSVAMTKNNEEEENKKFKNWWRAQGWENMSNMLTKSKHYKWFKKCINSILNSFYGTQFSNYVIPSHTKTRFNNNFLSISNISKLNWEENKKLGLNLEFSVEIILFAKSSSNSLDNDKSIEND